MVSSNRLVRCIEINLETNKIVSICQMAFKCKQWSKKTYKNTNMMAIGISKISEKATKRRIFDVCNSTMEISRRAPHHEFWPKVCEQMIRKLAI